MIMALHLATLADLGTANSCICKTKVPLVELEDSVDKTAI